MPDNSQISPRRKILLATSMGSFIAPFTSSLLSFSVPAIGNSLNSPYTLMIWVPIAFLIPLPSLMILIGKLSDTYGRALFYLVGLFIFAIGAVLATQSISTYFVIATVLVMGVGGSFLSVNAVAIVSNAYPPKERGGALGINAMSVYLGLTSAPTVSGFFIEFMGWKPLFYLVAAFALLTIVPVYRYIPRGEKRVNSEPIDLVGFFIFLFSILSIVLYLSFSEIYGWVHASYLLVIGIVLLAFFILNERKQSNPILNLKLFTESRTFSAANLTAFLNYISTFAIVFVFSIYFTVIAGLSPAHAGLILTVEPVMMVIFSPLSGKLSDRFGSRSLASLGMLLIAVGFFVIYFIVGNVSPVDMVWPLTLVGIGFGLFSAPNTNSVMSSVPLKEAGIASGTLGTMRFVGQLMSIAIMGSLLAAAMPRSMLLQLFSGITSGITTLDTVAFITGLREVMLVSGILCSMGVITSLIRNR